MAWVLLLALVTCAVYYHSLFHAPRADQLLYLHQTLDGGTLWGLLRRTYALNRSPALGDQALFRPLLYAVLAVERWAWGYEFRLWQATSLAVHVAVVLSLYQHVGRLLGPASRLSFALALFFGVLYAGMELVVWHHIIGYLVFSLCLVRAGLAWQQLLQPGAEPAHRRAAVALPLWCGVGAFSYELGNVVAVLFAVSLAWASQRAALEPAAVRRARRAALVLLLVPLAYASWSAIDYQRRFGFGHGAPDGERHLLMLAGAALRLSSAWAGAIWLPASLHMSINDRMRSHGISGFSDVVSGLWLCVGSGLLLVVVSCAAGLSWSRRRTAGAGPGLIQAAALGLLGAAYTAIIALGRSAREGVTQTLYSSPYYTYIFGLIMIMALAQLLARDGAARPGESPTRRAAALERGLVIGLLCIGLLSAQQTWAMNAHLRFQYGRPRLQLIDAVQRLLRQHSGEDDLSLSVSSECEGQQLLTWFARYDDQREPRLLSVLYPHLIRERGGKYQLDCPASGAPVVNLAPRLAPAGSSGLH